VSGGLALLRAFCQWTIEHHVSTVLYILFFSCNRRHRQGGQGAMPPKTISSISCHFVLWQAVSRIKNSCSLTVEVLVPKNFGLASLLLVTTFIQMACINLAFSHGPLLSIKPFTQQFRTWCSIFHWQKDRYNARPPDSAELRWKAVSSSYIA